MMALLTTCALFFVSLLVFEFIGYDLVGIYELRGGPPPISSIIHGTTSLKAFYLIACPLAIGVHRLTNFAISGRTYPCHHCKVLTAQAANDQAAT